MLLLLVLLMLSSTFVTMHWPIRSADAVGPLDFDIPNGHFYTQANGSPAGTDTLGYAVTNDSGVPLWNEFQRYGGFASLGYPVSRRMTWDGFTVQAFQKGILQWRPEAGQAWMVNVFDLLHDRGKDSWLQTVRSTPAPLPPDFDKGKQWPDIVRERLALLNDNAAIKNAYFANADPTTFYGLPVSRVVDNGNHFAIRLQRAVFQQWKVDVPWAKAGQVTVANGGDIAKEAGLLPADGLTPDLPPLGGGRVVVIDPGHGGNEVGTSSKFSDGTILREKDLNLRVALKVADLLTRAAFKPVLTRTTDRAVNSPPQLVTGHPPIGLDDELQARVDIANNANAQLFLSIHFNGNTNSKLHGSEVYYSEERPYSSDSKRFASLLLDNVKRGLASIGYGTDYAVVKTDWQALGGPGPGQHFYLLGPVSNIIVRPSLMPAALAEGLFMTNPTDALALRDERTLDVIARAYATAIYRYFPVSIPAPSPSAPSPSPSPPAPPPQVPPARTISTAPPAEPAPAIGQGRVINATGALMRAQPSTTAEVVQGLPNDATLDILQAVEGQSVNAGDPRWYRARYNGVEGFVYAAVVQEGFPVSAPAPSPSPPAPSKPAPANPVPAPVTAIGQGTIASSGKGARMRAEPNISAPVVQAMPDGASLDILQSVTGQAVDPGDGRWYRARYNGIEGFVYAAVVET